MRNTVKDELIRRIRRMSNDDVAKLMSIVERVFKEKEETDRTTITYDNIPHSSIGVPDKIDREFIYGDEE